MASNEDIEARLCAYIEGELDAPDRAEIEKYLAANPRQRQIVQELILGRSALRGLPRVPAPPEVGDAFGRQIERAALLGDADEPEQQFKLRTTRWRHFSAAAAILILVGGLAVVVALILPGSGPKTFTSALQPVPLVKEVPTADQSPQTPPPQGASPATQDQLSAARTAQSADPGNAPIAQTPGQQEAEGMRALAAEKPAAPPQAAAAPQTALAFAATPLLATPLQKNSWEQAGGMLDVRDVTQASAALHGALQSAGQEPSPGGAIYVIVHAPDAKAQVQRVQSQLDADAVAWTPLQSPVVAPAATQDAVAQMQNNSATQPADTASGNQALNDYQTANYKLRNQDIAKNDSSNVSALGADDTQTPAPTYVLVRRVDRQRAEELAGQLSSPVVNGAGGGAAPTSDVFRAYKNLNPAPAPSTQPATQPAILGGAVSTTEASPKNGADKLLAVGERVTLAAQDPLVKDTEAYRETQTIDADGNVTVPVVGKVRAAGLRLGDLTQSINWAYNEAHPAAKATWQVVAEPAEASQSAAVMDATTPATLPVQGALATKSPATMPTEPVDLVIVVRGTEASSANAQPAATEPASPLDQMSPAAGHASLPSTAPAPAATEPAQPPSEPSGPPSVPPATSGPSTLPSP